MPVRRIGDGGPVPGSSFGRLFRITTAGESHGPGNVVVIDGVPPGLPLVEADLEPDLRRRRPGQSSITTQRDEADRPEILSGVFEGMTTGAPVAILVRNEDHRSADYSEIARKYRPGHADYTFDAKFGRRDYRGGGRTSARETVARVAAGAVAKKILALLGVRIVGYVKQVGSIRASIPDPAAVTLEQVETNIVRCPDADAGARMTALIDAVRKDRDSIGGVAEVVATGVPAGLGEPVFDKLKADLAKAFFSLPAVLGFEYGAGFEVAEARGSENNDPFVMSPQGIATDGNRHGGMLGGVTSGMPLILRAAVKPTSSIPRVQKTVTDAGEPTEILVKGRHDPCLLPRFVPMAEAMTALVLVDHWLRWRAQRLDVDWPALLRDQAKE
jgi:chorismate synthase